MQENSLILRLLDVRWPNVARANIVKDNSVVKFQISDQQKRKNEWAREINYASTEKEKNNRKIPHPPKPQNKQKQITVKTNIQKNPVCWLVVCHWLAVDRFNCGSQHSAKQFWLSSLLPQTISTSDILGEREVTGRNGRHIDGYWVLDSADARTDDWRQSLHSAGSWAATAGRLFDSTMYRTINEEHCLHSTARTHISGGTMKGLGGVLIFQTLAVEPINGQTQGYGLGRDVSVSRQFRDVLSIILSIINHLIHTRQSYKHKINNAVHVVR